MNLLHLRYFAELARQEHYTRAAQILCITQPTLSNAIHLLEQELGVQLFEKQGRNICLTRCGEMFYKSVRQSLDELDVGVDSLRRTRQGGGEIRLGFVRPLGVSFVPELAARFLKENPGKDIRFSFHSGITGTLLEELSERKLDLVFSSRPPEKFGFATVPVYRQELVLIVPKDHPLADGRCVDLADTAPYPQVCFARGSGLREVVSEMYASIGVQQKVACETEEEQVVAGLVAKGFGIAAVPYMELLLRLDVKILPITNPPWERKFYLVSDAESLQLPAVRSFRRFVAECAACDEIPQTGVCP